MPRRAPAGALCLRPAKADVRTFPLVRVGDLTLVALPPDWLRVLVPPEPLTAAELIGRASGIAALLDGAMFSFCPGQPQDYARYRCGVVDYALADPVTGAFSAGRYPRRGGTLLVAEGRARVEPGSDPARWNGATLAWQGYPRIVESGRNVARRDVDAGRTERAGVGVLADGRVVLVSARSMSMWEFAEAAVAIGIVDLLYSDGGQSRVLAARTENGWVADDPTNLTARRLPSYLVALDPRTWAMRLR